MECAICNSKVHWVNVDDAVCGVCDETINGSNAYYCQKDDTFFHFKCLGDKIQVCNICGKPYDSGTPYKGGYAHSKCLDELAKNTMLTGTFQNVVPLDFDLFQ